MHPFLKQLSAVIPDPNNLCVFCWHIKIDMLLLFLPVRLRIECTRKNFVDQVLGAIHSGLENYQYYYTGTSPHPPHVSMRAVTEFGEGWFNELSKNSKAFFSDLNNMHELVKGVSPDIKEMHDANTSLLRGPLSSTLPNLTPTDPLVPKRMTAKLQPRSVRPEAVEAVYPYPNMLKWCMATGDAVPVPKGTRAALVLAIAEAETIEDLKGVLISLLGVIDEVIN